MFSSVSLCFLLIQHRAPSHGMVPHMLRVGLLEMSSQRYPELCSPGDSHPMKLIVKIKHLATVPFHTGRGWLAFHREFWALALAEATAETLFLTSSCSLCKPRRSVSNCSMAFLFSFFSRFQTTT